MSLVYLGLGSNIGDRRVMIDRAIECLSEKIGSILRGGTYESKDFGGTDQDVYMNTAIQGQTALTPQELLICVKEIESNLGRIHRYHWGPREIDIDILLYDDCVVNDHNLTIPHAGMHERDVVLAPLIDINPSLIHPVFNKTVKEFFDQLPLSKRFIIL